MDFKKFLNMIEPVELPILSNVLTTKKVMNFYLNQSIHASVKGLFTKVLLQYEVMTDNFKELLRTFLYCIY